ncbi:acyltransferase [Paenibacillus sp. P96]|uniref:Acyltransferase n=1 Tax=Paenibacillus zeirhizosphaerae TaxID=2987519 RepID=A0ABT9FP40_9BACL|nr:acyltransferase [Paenibacillus sp. P96]MDP4096503.1 acyltransferase [Paenibacillus sp. P96]
MEQVNERRLDGIDVLRGVAATMIIAFHALFIGGFDGKTSFDPVITKLDIGVRLFYALSAFSLMYGYDKKIEMENGLQKFYVSRFFRIAPLFYLCIIFYLIAMPKWFNTSVEITDLLTNLTFIFGILPGKHESVVWAGWSLGVEWIFYFMFPLFIICSKNIKNTMVLFILSIFIFYNFDILGAELLKISNSAFELNFLHHIVFFISGILSYRLFKVINFNKKVFRITFPVAIISILYLYFFTSFLGERIGDLLMACNFILIILYFSYFPAKYFTNKFFITLGLSSFGLYLLHPIVIIIYLKTDILNKLNLIPQNGNGAFFVFFAFTFLITFILASVSYKFFEYPMMKLGKKIANKKSIDIGTEKRKIA